MKPGLWEADRSGLVGRLVARGQPVPREVWDTFWERLRCNELLLGEAHALLASLSTAMPDAATVEALLASLRRGPSRRPPSPAADAVSIVGTGGGPRTFNVSTASAFVAAAMGVRVVKTGSRAYTTSCGSMDLLQLLRIPLTGSPAQTEELLDRFGIACTGHYVYAPELALLAKAVLPFPMRSLGKFFNQVGPFLADIPLAAQVTGVADLAILPVLRHLAAGVANRRVWLCYNDLGADELISFADNLLFPDPASSEPVRVTPEAFGLAAGTVEDLRPAASKECVVPHFMAVLAGDGPPAAVETVCLNAAALAVAGGSTACWEEAIRSARNTVARGHAVRLVESVRRHGERGAAGSTARTTTHA